MKYEGLTRVEIIDHTKLFDQGTSRVYAVRQERVNVEVSVQDGGKTLKVFIAGDKND